MSIIVWVILVPVSVDSQAANLLEQAQLFIQLNPWDLNGMVAPGLGLETLMMAIQGWSQRLPSTSLRFNFQAYISVQNVHETSKRARATHASNIYYI